MKKFKLVLVALVLFAVTGYAQEKSTGWPEMKTFHSLMAATFHPSEDGDLKPLREKADSLYGAAKAWQNSAVPSSYKPEETKEALRKLVTKCGDISKLVVIKASDDQLKKNIAEAHELFHKIAGECKKADN